MMACASNNCLYWIKHATATDHKSNKQRELNVRTFFTGLARWGKWKVFYWYFVSGSDNESLGKLRNPQWIVQN